MSAISAVYRRAAAARLVSEDPAAKLDKPARLPNRRRALTDAELAELWGATKRLSRDPALELLIVRFGARRRRRIMTSRCAS